MGAMPRFLDSAARVRRQKPCIALQLKDVRHYYECVMSAHEATYSQSLDPPTGSFPSSEQSSVSHSKGERGSVQAGYVIVPPIACRRRPRKTHMNSVAVTKGHIMLEQ